MSEANKTYAKRISDLKINENDYTNGFRSEYFTGTLLASQLKQASITPSIKTGPVKAKTDFMTQKTAGVKGFT